MVYILLLNSYLVCQHPISWSLLSSHLGLYILFKQTMKVKLGKVSEYVARLQLEDRKDEKGSWKPSIVFLYTFCDWKWGGGGGYVLGQETV